MYEHLRPPFDRVSAFGDEHQQSCPGGTAQLRLVGARLYVRCSSCLDLLAVTVERRDLDVLKAFIAGHSTGFIRELS
jgi:hypothetical protein